MDIKEFCILMILYLLYYLNLIYLRVEFLKESLPAGDIRKTHRQECPRYK